MRAVAMMTTSPGRFYRNSILQPVATKRSSFLTEFAAVSQIVDHIAPHEQAGGNSVMNRLSNLTRWLAS